MANTTTAVATISSAELARGTSFSERQVDLIREQIADGATDDELMLFIQVASSRGLDPFRKHIYAVSRYDAKKKKYVMAYQVSIDGLRLIAERTGRYEGQTLPQWCGLDGVWKDVWLAEEPPAAAKVGVYIKGAREPLYAIALYRTFVQTYTPQGSDNPIPTKFWKEMPEHMLAKVAESHALRKAFPEEAGGLFTRDQAKAGASDEFVDVDSGEITVETAAERRERLTKRIHALGRDRGWGHDELSYKLKLHNQGSGFREAPTAALEELAQWLEDGNGEVERQLTQIKNRIATPQQLQAAVAGDNTEPKRIDTSPITDAEAEAIEATGTAQPELVAAAVGATQDRFRGDGAS